MALPLGQTQDFGEMQPEVSGWSVAQAAWDNAGLTSTFTGAVTQSMQREELASRGKPISPEVANGIFPGLNADRDITLSEAEFIMERRNKVKENQDIIDRASDSFLKGTALPFVAGAARAMVDPIDMGINLITGGIGTGLKVGAGLGRKIAIDAAEAAVGATIAEAAVAKEMTESFEEYTSKHFLQNVIGASVLQIGITHGAPAAWKGSAKALDFAGAKTSDNLIKLADTLESKGVSSFKGVSHLIEKIKGGVNKVDEVNMAAKNVLGDKVELGDDLPSTMKNVVEAHENGKITDQELSDFRESAIAGGVDERILKQAVDNETPFEFSDQEIAEFKEIINDEKSQSGYNKEAHDMDKEMDGFDPERLKDQHIEARKEVPEGEKVAPEIAKEVEIETRSIKEQEFFREFAACRRGA